MNLKLVAVSMSVLGLITSPVFADTMHKHKHARKHYDSQDYKGSGSMPVAASPLADLTAPIDSASLATVMLSDMQQNSNLSKPHAEWFHHIAINGGVEVGTVFGSRTNSNDAYAEIAATDTTTNVGYLGENTKRFSNRFYANLSANINDWTKALVVLNSQSNSLLYNTAQHPVSMPAANLYNNNVVSLEQAFVHVGNFENTPFFAEIGKQFVDYGRYDVHAITQSLPQVLTETLASAVKLGYINDMGLGGSVYAFQNSNHAYKAVDPRQEATINYGAAINYSYLNAPIAYKLGVAYTYDMMGINGVADVITNTENYNGYSNHVGGLAAYADMSYDAFTLGANYTTALKHFSAADLPQSLNHDTIGARPWAVGFQAGYGFNAWSKNNNVYVGYQASRDTVYLNMPQSRYLVGYSIDVLKNTKISAEWDHDNAWSYTKDGGSRNGDSNLVALRAAVKFG